ncbi:hypothetical protein DE4576_05493 [Mycobacterium marinum]|nr:hypothetical protein DE4576_05493 [Mycobacterium marinum]
MEAQWVQLAGERDSNLDHIGLARGEGIAVKEQSLLQRSQRQQVLDGVTAFKIVDLALGQRQARKVCGGQSAPTGVHMSADRS